MKNIIIAVLAAIVFIDSGLFVNCYLANREYDFQLKLEKEHTAEAWNAAGRVHKEFMRLRDGTYQIEMPDGTVANISGDGARSLLDELPLESVK